MVHLCAVKQGKQTISNTAASDIVAEEVCNDWIMKNVYPMKQSSVAQKIKNDYDKFKLLRKQEHEKSRKLTDKWVKNATDFNDRMTKVAYDIRTLNIEYHKKLEEKYRVKMTAEDDLFYKDNCHGSYVATCSSFASSKWQKQAKRVEQRSSSILKKKEKKEETEKK